ncbi:DUF1775 domain-containing protein [Lutibaculum baratangense]|uniref:Copper metallochaperone n=1 Tax=Lutibaculum baratangense AMV1 TaxID=631454 RepID=V4RM33_9HYPH|nr:DUF1775 domain-containing protein [Lutibaculum baratangense]ESR27076.1 Copper metallochaperone [Lutibaculum baratangense AMV1]
MKKICMLGAAAAVLAAVSPAQAHVTLEQDAAAGETYYKAVFRVPHGCAPGQATNKVTVRLPEGFISAKPMPKAGWQLETVTGAYAEPHEIHGETVAEGVREVTWTGELPDEFYDEFVVRGRISGVPAGGELAFPVIQTCGESEVAWSEMAAEGEDPHDLDASAPTLRVAEGGASIGHAHAAPGHAAEEPGSAVLGDISISRAWIRATPPAAKVAGGYLTVTNAGEEDDTLVGGSVFFADGFEIHEMSMVNGVMQMRELPRGLKVPAGQTVTFEPGGLHLMLTNVKDPPAEGEFLKLTLRFERAGEVTLDVPVSGIGARSYPGGAAGAETDSGAAGVGHEHDHGHGATGHAH